VPAGGALDLFAAEAFIALDVLVAVWTRKFEFSHTIPRVWNLDGQKTRLPS
jgi:hypothetical protein